MLPATVVALLALLVVLFDTMGSGSIETPSYEPTVERTGAVRPVVAATMRDVELAEDSARNTLAHRPVARFAPEPWCLRGRVVLADGETPVEGVHAIVRDHAARAVTGPDGTFELPGLPPGAPVVLVLGGRGHVGARPAWTVDPSQNDRDWQVHRLFASRVRLLDARGGQLRAAPGVVGTRAGRLAVGTGGVFPVTLPAPSARLAGVAPELLESRDPRRRLLLYRSARSDDEIGPCTFTVDLPGYERAETDVILAAVDGEIAEHDLLLDAIAPGFGALELQLVGWFGACEPFPAHRSPAARLRLVSEAYGSVTIDLDSFDELGSLRVEPLPFGEWHAELYAPGERPGKRDWSWSGSIMIGPSPVPVEVDLSDRTTLDVKVLNRAGVEHTGHVIIGVGTPDRSAMEVRAIEHPPYRLDVRAGKDYLLELRSPRAGRDVRTIVHAVGGNCVSVVLQQ